MSNRRWYFKNFRIFDDPNKDIPEEEAIVGAFDNIRGMAIVDAHNEIIDRLEAELTCANEECGGLQEIREKLEAEIEQYRNVTNRCIKSMEGSNCLELEWLEKALKKGG